MRLETESPMRMIQTVRDRFASVLLDSRSVHGLKKEVCEVEPFISERFSSRLRKDELELVSTLDNELDAGFRAHANPVDPHGNGLRAIRLDGDFESARMQCVDERSVQL